MEVRPVVIPRPSFTTYCMCTMGGRLYSGMPSLDVAISMAIDFERYQDDVDDDGAFERVEVTVAMNARECDDLPPFTHVYGERSRGVGIHAETRCVACRRA